MNEPTFAEVLAGGRAATASSAPSLGAAPALASALQGSSNPAANASSGTAAAASALLGTPGAAASMPLARLAAPGSSQVTAALPADARRALTVPTLQNLLPTLAPMTSPGSGSAEVAQALEAIAPGTTAAGLPVASQSAGPAAPAGAPAGLSRRRAGLGAPLAGPLPSQALPVASPSGPSATASAADLAAAGSTEVAIPGSSAAAAASAVPAAAPSMALARSLAGSNQMLPVPPVVTGAFQDIAGRSGATVPLLGERALSSDVSEMLSPPAGGDGATPAQPITYLPPHSVDSAGPSGTSYSGPSASAPSPRGNASTAGLSSLPTLSVAPQENMTTVGSPAGDAGRSPAVARPPAAGSAAAGGLVEGNVVQSVSANDGAASAPSTPPPASAAAPSTAPAAGTPAATGGALSAADVDGLATRLYEPIARRLRAELVVDRDRTGTLMDRMW
ncbi:hypothetical protein OG474_44915 [Kribbella sp. NBC_01505]|uniref:hypothetical protein n=1 Tax=Kribbella sp. NBC_01505 TaxID=2903580 RepID=UPI003864B5A9